MAAAPTIEEIYEQQIKPRPASERLRLLAMIARDLAKGAATYEPRERSLLELEGVGAELWQGIDAQEYVDALRDEWDRRPGSGVTG